MCSAISSSSSLSSPDQASIPNLVEHFSHEWEESPPSASPLPMLILSDAYSYLHPQFFDALEEFLNFALIDLEEVEKETKNYLAVVEGLLQKAQKLNLPLAFYLKKPSKERIASLKQLKHAYQLVSAVFDPFETNEEDTYDLALGSEWFITNGYYPVIAAFLFHKFGYGKNSFTALELVAVNKARHYLALGQRPPRPITMPQWLVALADSLIPNCLAHMQRVYPSLNEQFSSVANREEFLKHCIFYMIVSEPSYLIADYYQGGDGHLEMFRKLSLARSFDKATFQALTKESQGRNVLFEWWPFDTHRLVVWGVNDLLYASRLSTGKMHFIAASAPTNVERLSYLWKLVLQEKAAMIVSLATAQEFLNPSLAEEIKLKTAISLNEYSALNEITCGEERTIWHFHFNEWEDGEAIAPVDLYFCIKQVEKKRHKEGPVLVHCKAGIGRTGTFCACYELYMRFQEHIEKGLKKEEFNPDIWSLVLEMNLQRHMMVQNLEQYSSLHRFVKLLRDL